MTVLEYKSQGRLVNYTYICKNEGHCFANILVSTGHEDNQSNAAKKDQGQLLCVRRICQNIDVSSTNASIASTLYV